MVSRIRIGDLCAFQNGGTPSKEDPKFWNGTIPWISSADIADGAVQRPRHFITEAAVASSAVNVVDAGTVLLVTRVGVGKVAIAPTRLAFSQDITALTFGENVDLRYISRFLASKAPHMNSLARGATIKGITREVVADLQLDLPPLPEQQRIAAILDKADEIRKKRELAISKLDQLAQSVFVEMFGDPAKEIVEGRYCEIRDYIESASYGTSEKASLTGTYPVLRMNNITSLGDLDLTNLKYMELDEDERDRYLVHRGDVLFNRTNSAELVGKTAVYDRDEPAAYAGYLIRLRVGENALPEFLSGFLNTPFAKKMLRSMCKSIIGMANINAQEIQNMRIPKASIVAQRKYVRAIQAIQDQKARQRASMSKNLELSAALKAAVFQ